MVLLLAMLAACHTTPAVPETSAMTAQEATVASIRSEYRDSYRAAVSLEVDPYVVGLCRMALPGADYPYHLGDDMEQKITVFVNEAAWPAMQQTGERTFAPGSVVVKEKTDGALGIMVKSDAQDWRYLEVDAQGQVEDDQVKLAHCVSCHERGAVPQGVPLAEEIVLGQPQDAVFLSATVR